MALTAEIEAFLTDLEKVDPAGAKEQRAIFDKHPSLQKSVQEAVLRQNDYDRNMNASKEKLAEAGKWSQWATDNMPIYHQTRADLKEATEKITRLEAEVEAKTIAAAAAAGGNTADVEKITAAVKAAITEAGGMPTKAELAKLISEATADQMKTAKADFFEKEVPRSMAFQGRVTQAQIRYFRETGKDLDLGEFAKFITDGNYSDPLAAYDRYMEPTTRQKSIDEEVKKQVTVKEEELKKQFGATGIPGSSGPQSPGHLQIRLTEKKPNDPLFSQDIELGDNAAAMAAAAELRSEGKVA